MFGILRSLGSSSMTDWATAPQIARIEGPGLVVTQIFLAAGPKQVTYRVLCGSVADAQDLESLVTLTGTLTLVHGQHSATPTSSIRIVDRVYDRITNVTLMALGNREVFVGGSVEVDATFQWDG